MGFRRLSPRVGLPFLSFLVAVAQSGPPALAQSEGARGSALFDLASPRFGGWRLVLEGRAFLQAQSQNPDPRWLRLWTAGLQTMAGGNGSPLDPNLAPGGKRLQWALVDSARKVHASGEGSPDLLLVEGALRKSLGALPWEILDEILRAHPGHGEARLAEAESQLALTAPYVFGDTRPPARYERLRSQAVAALDKLLDLPDWPWQLDLALEPYPGMPRLLREAPEIAALDRREVRETKPASPALLAPATFAPGRLAVRLYQQAAPNQDTLRRMAREVLAALAVDPASPRLQANFAFLLRTIALVDTEGAERLLADLSGVVSLPGQAWPPLPLIHAQADVLRYLGRWSDLLNQSRAWSRKPDRLFLDAGSWDRHLYREGTLEAYAAMARSWLEGWEILPAALTSLREHRGGAYGELARLALRGARLPDAPSQERTDLFKLLLLPSLAAPAMPQPFGVWRVEVREPQEVLALNEAFDRAPSLVQWLPSERRVLQSAARGIAWRAFLGEDLRAEGERLPVAEALSDLMLAGRPGRLWTVSDRVAREPDAAGPRRLRISLLLERMPCRALETVLAGDLSRTLSGAELQFEGLDENLWFVEARHAVPALEEHLRRWPLDGARWEALAFWTAFLPSHRGPVELAETLPGFQSGRPFLLCLPASSHARVGNQLRKRKAWPALRAWCEPAWEGLQALDSGSPAGQALVRELGPLLRGFLDTAYTSLGLSGERRLLQEAGRNLDSAARTRP